MTTNERRKTFEQLLLLPKETEWVEFKEAKQTFDFDKLGRYFSALSNEANLNGKDCAWLVLGVRDGDRKVVGTNYRPGESDLDNLKSEMANHTNNRITFTMIYTLLRGEERVIMFKIPPASNGIPTSWKGHYYGREGESINALSLEEIERIRDQTKPDWTAQIYESATIGDLAPEAITKAREQYKQKHPEKPDQIDLWDDFTFLNKAKLTISRKITAAAIILLGKEESEHFITPSVARITWILKDAAGTERDYQHFGPPFILNVDGVLSSIRNLRYRYLPHETLFPIEITKYDPWVIREALHNCIAHQDYTLRGKINVIEHPDELIFSNVGSFIPGDVETVIRQDSPPAFYRNPFLSQAMVNLNMIDTIGGGIKRMFNTQKERFFPLPDYDFTRPNTVSVRIQGKILDEKYTRLLIKNRDLNLSTVMLLDKVQKRIPISKDEHTILKSQELVEGRYPNVFLFSQIAAATETKADYIKYRGFDKKYYQDMILEFIRENGCAARKEIDQLLTHKLPEVLTDLQKKVKINNLLAEMSCKRRVIENRGSRRCPKWVLTSGSPL